MTTDLNPIVSVCDVLIVSHRLKPDTWATVKFRPRQRVIDLINIPDLRKAPGYEGLHW